jgi:hypothetical protein
MIFFNRSPLPTPPAGLTLALTGLWWDAKGDWTRAHESAQQDEGIEGSWVHAYLHRKEGDQSNAEYWYVGQVSQFAENRLMRNGSASRRVCWDRSRTTAGAGRRVAVQRLLVQLRFYGVRFPNGSVQFRVAPPHSASVFWA